MKPLSFCDHLRKQQHKIKLMQLCRKIEDAHKSTDREPDLKEMLAFTLVDPNIVAVTYPVSTN